MSSWPQAGLGRVWCPPSFPQCHCPGTHTPELLNHCLCLEVFHHHYLPCPLVHIRPAQPSWMCCGCARPACISLFPACAMMDGDPHCLGKGWFDRDLSGDGGIWTISQRGGLCKTLPGTLPRVTVGVCNRGPSPNPGLDAKGCPHHPLNHIPGETKA